MTKTRILPFYTFLDLKFHGFKYIENNLVLDLKPWKGTNIEQTLSFGLNTINFKSTGTILYFYFILSKLQIFSLCFLIFRVFSQDWIFFSLIDYILRIFDSFTQIHADEWSIKGILWAKISDCNRKDYLESYWDNWLEFSSDIFVIDFVLLCTWWHLKR